MRRSVAGQAEFGYISDVRSIRPEYGRGKMPGQYRVPVYLLWRSDALHPAAPHLCRNSAPLVGAVAVMSSGTAWDRW